MSDHYEVELEQHPIELYKLLKIANLVSGGGEAKVVISEGYVLLNGDVETQKRKKVFSGDIIEFNGDIIEMICHAEPTVTLPRTPKQPSNSNTEVNKQSALNKKFKHKAKHSGNSQKNKSTKQNSHSNKNTPEKSNNQPEPASPGKRRSIKFD